MDKASILAAMKKKPVPVTVGDVTLYVKPLTVAQKEAFALWRKDNPGPVGVVPRLLAASLCDESGALLLGSPEEAAELDGAVCDVLCERIAEINGLTQGAPGNASSPSGQN